MSDQGDTGIRGIVAGLIVFYQEPEHIDGEAMDPAIEPEMEHVVHGPLDFRIAP